MSEEEDILQIEAWAQRVEAAGLMPIAVPLLELARAFGFLASQALLLSEPLLVGITSQSAVRQTAEWLEDPERVDRLLARLLEEE